MPFLLLCLVAFLADLMLEDLTCDFGVFAVRRWAGTARGFASFPTEKLALVILGLAPFLAGPASQDARDCFRSSSCIRRGPPGSSCRRSRCCHAAGLDVDVRKVWTSLMPPYSTFLVAFSGIFGGLIRKVSMSGGRLLGHLRGPHAEGLDVRRAAVRRLAATVGTTFMQRVSTCVLQTPPALLVQTISTFGVQLHLLMCHFPTSGVQVVENYFARWARGTLVPVVAQWALVPAVGTLNLRQVWTFYAQRSSQFSGWRRPLCNASRRASG